MLSPAEAIETEVSPGCTSSAVEQDVRVLPALGVANAENRRSASSLRSASDASPAPAGSFHTHAAVAVHPEPGRRSAAMRWPRPARPPPAGPSRARRSPSATAGCRAPRPARTPAGRASPSPGRCARPPGCRRAGGMRSADRRRPGPGRTRPPDRSRCRTPVLAPRSMGGRAARPERLPWSTGPSVSKRSGGAGVAAKDVELPAAQRDQPSGRCRWRSPGRSRTPPRPRGRRRRAVVAAGPGRETAGPSRRRASHPAEDAGALEAQILAHPHPRARVGSTQPKTAAAAAVPGQRGARSRPRPGRGAAAAPVPRPGGRRQPRSSAAAAGGCPQGGALSFSSSMQRSPKRAR